MLMLSFSGKKNVSKTHRQTARTRGKSDTKGKSLLEPEATTSHDKNGNVELQKLSVEKLTADAGIKDDPTKSNTGGDGEQPIPIKVDGQEPIEIKMDGQDPNEIKMDGQEPIPIKKEGQEPIEIENKANNKQLTAETAKAAVMLTDDETHKAQSLVGDTDEGEASNAQDEGALLNEDIAAIQLDQVNAEMAGAQEASGDVEIHAADAPAEALPVDGVEKPEKEARGVAMEATVEADAINGANADVTKETDVTDEIKVDVTNEVQRRDETTESEVSNQSQGSSNAEQSEEDDDEAEMPWTDMSFSQPLVAQLSEVVRVGVIARVPENEAAAETSNNEVDDSGKDGDKNNDEQSDAG